MLKSTGIYEYLQWKYNMATPCHGNAVLNMIQDLL